jgi:hypothetical protein
MNDAVVFPLSILIFTNGSACVVIDRIALRAFCLLSDPNVGYSFLVTILHFQDIALDGSEESSLTLLLFLFKGLIKQQGEH